MPCNHLGYCKLSQRCTPRICSCPKHHTWHNQQCKWSTDMIEGKSAVKLQYDPTHTNNMCCHRCKHHIPEWWRSNWISDKNNKTKIELDNKIMRRNLGGQQKLNWTMKKIHLIKFCNKFALCKINYNITNWKIKLGTILVMSKWHNVDVTSKLKKLQHW